MKFIATHRHMKDHPKWNDLRTPDFKKVPVHVDLLGQASAPPEEVALIEELWPLHSIEVQGGGCVLCRVSGLTSDNAGRLKGNRFMWATHRDGKKIGTHGVWMPCVCTS